MNPSNDIIDRERAFWTSSVEFYERRLAKNVLMVFPPPVGALTRDGVLAGIRAGMRWSSVEMSDVAVQPIGEGMVGVAYRARATKSEPKSDYTALIGSVYVLEDEAWKLAFHQHTPIDEAKRHRS